MENLTTSEEYILPRANVCDYIYLCNQESLENDPRRKVRKVFFRYPQQSHDTAPFPDNLEVFTFPFTEPYEEYQFLIKPNRNKLYCHCFNLPATLTLIPGRTSLCFLSALPYETIFKTCFHNLIEYYSDYINGYYDPGIKIFLGIVSDLGNQLIFSAPIPLPGVLTLKFDIKLKNSSYKYKIDTLACLETHEIVFTKMAEAFSLTGYNTVTKDTFPLVICLDDYFPLLVYPVQYIFEFFDVKTVVKIWTYLMLEIKVVFVSENYKKLLTILEIFLALLYPWRWLHTYVPVLPEDLIEIINAPFSIIAGVRGSSSSFNVSDGVLVDIDCGFAFVGSSCDIYSLPLIDQNYLISSLNDALSDPSIRIESQIKNCFLLTVCILLIDFDYFLMPLAENDVLFNLDKFLTVRSKHDEKDFFRKLLETNAFEHFKETLELTWLENFRNHYAKMQSYLQKKNHTPNIYSEVSFNDFLNITLSDSRYCFDSKLIFEITSEENENFIEFGKPLLSSLPRAENILEISQSDLKLLNVLGTSKGYSLLALKSDMSMQRTASGLKKLFSLLEYDFTFSEISYITETIDPELLALSNSVDRNEMTLTNFASSKSKIRNSSKQIFAQIERRKDSFEVVKHVIIDCFLERNISEESLNEVFLAFRASSVARTVFLNNVSMGNKLVPLEEYSYKIMVRLVKVFLYCCSQSQDFSNARILLKTCQNIQLVESKNSNFSYGLYDHTSLIFSRSFPLAFKTVEHLEHRISLAELSICKSLEFWSYYVEYEREKSETETTSLRDHLNNDSAQQEELFRILAETMNKMVRMQISEERITYFLDDLSRTLSFSSKTYHTLKALLVNLCKSKEKYLY